MSEQWIGRQGVQLPLPAFTVESALPFYRWIRRGVGIYDAGVLHKRLKEENHGFILMGILDIAKVRLDSTLHDRQPWNIHRQRRYLTESRKTWGLK